MYENPTIEDLIINVTDRCNLNCAHCFKGGAGADELSLQIIKKIIDEAGEYGLKRVDYSGGECLLYSKLYSLIELSKNYPGIEFGFISNGLMVSDELLDKISEIKKAYFQISLDGASKETYESVRGKDTFESFMQAIEIIKAHPFKHKRSRTVINSVNYDEITEMYNLAISHAMLPSFLFTAQEGNAVENWQWLNISDIKKIHVNNIISRLNKQNDLQVGLISPGGGCDLSMKRERKTFVIGANGNVFFCDYLLDYPLGNLNKNSFNEILRGIPLQELYAVEEKRIKTLSERCNNCKIFSECHYGCPGEARIKDQGDYSLCKYRKLYYACVTNQYF